MWRLRRLGESCGPCSAMPSPPKGDGEKATRRPHRPPCYKASLQRTRPKGRAGRLGRTGRCPGEQEGPLARVAGKPRRRFERAPRLVEAAGAKQEIAARGGQRRVVVQRRRAGDGVDERKARLRP